MEEIITAIYDLVGKENKKGELAPAQRVKYIMQKLDKNHNGTLSENECKLANIA